MLVPIDSKSSEEFINVKKIITRGQKWSKSGQKWPKMELLD